ncbi:MAG: 16S rRNA (adenine(1518)-N(6)/adenine(1519)-N(6))-dimethyltransferase RsmA [Clostridia bacterium]
MKINTKLKTKQILEQYDIRANKRYGQNFLIDDNVLKSIIDISNIKDDELVIEIGPGLGNLTEYILQYSSYAILVEIDNKMIDVLNDRFKTKGNYTLINEDILKTDIDDIIKNIEKKNNKKYNKIKVVANLPYYITTPIIFKLLQDSKRIDQITVMVQKEVAKRMVAVPKTKDYGILTLMVDYLSDAKIELEVLNTSFIPSPDVTSSVILLKKKNKYMLNEEKEKELFELIHKAFAQRRKKMINSLVSTSFCSKEKLEKVFKLLALNSNIRAEELPLDTFIQIVEKL